MTSKNILLGNGVNINFGGKDYCNYKIIERLVNNLSTDRYNGVFGGNITQEELLCVVTGLNDIFRKIMKSGIFSLRQTEGEDEMRTLIDISKRYHGKSQDILDVGMEDYFFVLKWFNNGYEDGAALTNATFDGLKMLFLDAIYNESKIESLYCDMGSFSKELQKYTNIFTVNYDTNIDKISTKTIFHLHGSFDVLDDTYRPETVIGYVAHNKANPPKIISHMKHIFCNGIMGFSGQYKMDKMNVYANSNMAMDIMIPRFQNPLDDEAQMKYTQLEASKVEEDIFTLASIKACLAHPELRNTEYPIKQFEEIDGELHIIGMSPNNDSHIFRMINDNPRITKVIYFYASSEDMEAAQRVIKKSIQLRDVFKFWKSL